MRSAVAPSLLRHSVARNTFRQGNLASKRFASTTESTQKKAQDALSSAGKAAETFFESVTKFLGPVGERAGNMLGSYKQPLLYNLSVTKEVLKQIYIKEGLQPPSVATFKLVYSSVWAQLTTPGALKNIFQGQELARFGIYGLQAYGVFKIGEILGRRSLVGYNIH